MQKESLSGRQLVCVTAVYIIGSSSAVGSSGMAGRDIWAAMLLAVAAAVPLVLLYGRIAELYPGQTLFDMLYTAFGKRVGWLVTLAVTIYAFFMGALVLRDFPEFVHATSLRKTPIFVFALLLALVCAYLARQGAVAFGKAGILFAWIVASVVMLTFLLLIPNMHLKYLRPVLATSREVIAWNAGKLLSMPFGETVLLLCLFCRLERGQSARKSFLLGLLLGGTYLTISVLRNILALGAENFASLYFPSHSAVSTINIGDFFQRVEVMVASYLLICDIMKIAVAIYAICLGAGKFMRLEKIKKAALPVGMLMVPTSLLAARSTMRFYDWNPTYLLYIAPFQVIIPLALWILGEVRSERQGKKF